MCGLGFKPGNSLYCAARDAEGNSMRGVKFSGTLEKMRFRLAYQFQFHVTGTHNYHFVMCNRCLQCKQTSVTRCAIRTERLAPLTASTEGQTKFACHPLLSCCSNLLVQGNAKPAAIVWYRNSSSGWQKEMWSGVCFVLICNLVSRVGNKRSLYIKWGRYCS
jgi:hypothetical protein